LECGVVNSGEIARAAGLLLFRLQGEGIHVDTSVGCAGVALEGLDNVEVRTLTLREAVLAVELELGSHNGVLAPTVHIEGGLGKNEGSGIRDSGLCDSTVVKSCPAISLNAGLLEINGGGVVEKTAGKHEVVGGNLCGTTESEGCIGESINSISVVEGLGT